MLLNLPLCNTTNKKMIPSCPIIPRLYGLPKTHKSNVPLKPIVNTIGSPTYLLAKFLASRLREIVGKIESCIKESTHFVTMIKNIKVEKNDISFEI